MPAVFTTPALISNVTLDLIYIYFNYNSTGIYNGFRTLLRNSVNDIKWEFTEFESLCYNPLK